MESLYPYPIKKVIGKRVTLGEFLEGLLSYEGHKVRIEVLRDGKQKTLRKKIPKNLGAKYPPRAFD